MGDFKKVERGTKDISLAVPGLAELRQVRLAKKQAKAQRQAQAEEEARLKQQQEMADKRSAIEGEKKAERRKRLSSGRKGLLYQKQTDQPKVKLGD